MRLRRATTCRLAFPVFRYICSPYEVLSQSLRPLYLSGIQYPNNNPINAIQHVKLVSLCPNTCILKNDESLYVAEIASGLILIGNCSHLFYFAY